MHSLTPREAELRDYIARYVREHDGVGPRHHDCTIALGLPWDSGIARIVRSLEMKGAVTRIVGKQRSLNVTDDTQTDFACDWFTKLRGRS